MDSCQTGKNVNSEVNNVEKHIGKKVCQEYGRKKVKFQPISTNSAKNEVMSNYGVYFLTRSQAIICFGILSNSNRYRILVARISFRKFHWPTCLTNLKKYATYLSAM